MSETVQNLLSSSTPPVTVCVPVRNGSKTIRCTLDSILAQDYPNFEVIVSDNCSTDDTASIIQEYADRGVKYYLNPKLEAWGESNWNNVLSLASGPFIALYHADDIYTPTMVRRQAEFLQAHPEVSSVFTGTQCIDEFDRPIRLKSTPFPDEYKGQEVFEFPELFNAVLKYGNFMTVPTLMTRRETLDAVGVFNHQEFATASDIDLWLRMARWRPIGIINEPLHRYRVSSQQGSVQLNKRRTHLAHFFWVIDHYLNKPDVKHIIQSSALTIYQRHRNRDYVICAVNLLELGRAKEAMTCLKTALRASPRPGRFRLLVGVVLLVSIWLGLGIITGHVIYRLYQWILRRQRRPI